MAHKSDRIAWVDVAKGIGILAVILGHNGTRLMAAAVFPWHMPLFFMLSGLFLSARLNYAEFCRRKIKSLMLPFAATAIALIMADCCWTAYRNGLAEVPMCFVQSVLRAIGGSGSLSVFGVIGPVGAIWFLEALCLALLLVGFVANSRYRYPIVVALFMLAWWSRSWVWLPFNIQSGLFAAPFVLYGYDVLRRIEIRGRISYVMSVIGLALLMIILCRGRPHMSMARNFATPFDLVASLFIVQMVLLISIWLSTLPFVCRVLSWYGRNSLIILCCHLFELHEVPWTICFSRIGIQFNTGTLYVIVLLFAKMLFVTMATVMTSKILLFCKEHMIRESHSN